MEQENVSARIKHYVFSRVGYFPVTSSRVWCKNVFHVFIYTIFLLCPFFCVNIQARLPHFYGWLMLWAFLCGLFTCRKLRNPVTGHQRTGLEGEDNVRSKSHWKSSRWFLPFFVSYRSIAVGRELSLRPEMRTYKYDVRHYCVGF